MHQQTPMLTGLVRGIARVELTAGGGHRRISPNATNNDSEPCTYDNLALKALTQRDVLIL